MKPPKKALPYLFLYEAILTSQLRIKKAELHALTKAYASYAQTTYPLIQAVNAAIIEIELQLQELE